MTNLGAVKRSRMAMRPSSRSPLPRRADQRAVKKAYKVRRSAGKRYTQQPSPLTPRKRFNTFAPASAKFDLSPGVYSSPVLL